MWYMSEGGERGRGRERKSEGEGEDMGGCSILSTYSVVPKNRILGISRLEADETDRNISTFPTIYYCRGRASRCQSCTSPEMIQVHKI